MANEITISGRITYKDGYINDGVSKSAYHIDQIGTASVAQTVDLIKDEVTELDLGDIAELGYCYFRNLTTATSLSDFIEIGYYQDSIFYPFIKAYAGEPQLVPWGLDGVFVRPNADGQQLFYWLNSK